jgi:hypothetical protein
LRLLAVSVAQDLAEARPPRTAVLSPVALREARERP